MQQTSKELLAQEDELRFVDFTAEDAWHIARMLSDDAKVAGRAVLIHIQLGSRTLFHWEATGTTPDNLRWMQMKKRVAELYEHSSATIEALVRESRLSLSQWGQLDELQYSASGGSFPIRLQSGAMIGTINVSGYDADGDHNAILRVLRRNHQSSDVD